LLLLRKFKRSEGYDPLIGAERSPTLRGTRYYGKHLAGVQSLS
jgi:hypothetical protein